MPRVRCAGHRTEFRTEFLDASGAVIANADNAAQKICYVAGFQRAHATSQLDNHALTPPGSVVYNFRQLRQFVA